MNDLKEYGLDVDACDSSAYKTEAQEEQNITLLENLILDNYLLIILAVPHTVFLDTKDFDYASLSIFIIFDLKSVLPKHTHTMS